MKTLLILGLVLGFASFICAQGTEYPLRAGERISISISGVMPEEVAQLSKVYTISETGTISLLHINKIQAAGLKPSALERAIEDAYKTQELYTNPSVTVSIDNEEAPRQVYVSGVNQPGPKPFKSNLTAMQAIMASGGPNAFSRLSKTRIVRTRTDGSRQTISVDLSQYTKNPEVDVTLQPEDQVIVPEN